MSSKKQSKSKSAVKKTAKKSKTELPDIVMKDEEFIEELRNLDDNDEKTVKMMSLIMKGSSSYSGPLPTAEQFKIYEETCEGAANRIIGCMEREQEFRHQVDIISLEASIKYDNKGQNYGFYVMLALIAGAVVSSILGQTAVALGFVGMSALSVVPKFIQGKNKGTKNDN